MCVNFSLVFKHICLSVYLRLCTTHRYKHTNITHNECGQERNFFFVLSLSFSTILSLRLELDLVSFRAHSHGVILHNSFVRFFFAICLAEKATKNTRIRAHIHMSVWTMRFIICRIILCDWKHFQRSFVNKCVYILGTQIYKISYGLLAMKGRKKLRERRIILTNACLYMHLCTKNAATTRRNKKESKQESFFLSPLASVLFIRFFCCFPFSCRCRLSTAVVFFVELKLRCIFAIVHMLWLHCVRFAHTLKMRDALSTSRNNLKVKCVVISYETFMFLWTNIFLSAIKKWK